MILSSNIIIKCDVTQESILGTCLFIYTVCNDIVATNSLFDIILFADNTTCYTLILTSHQKYP